MHLRSEHNSLKPSLFIVGAPKCGTTAMASYLGNHPRVLMSVPKEPFFWSVDIPRNVHELGPTTLTAYEKMFSRSRKPTATLGAEASTRYLRSRRAVDLIMEYNPEANIVAMIRNPVEIAYSFHMEQRAVFQEPEADFATAWAEQSWREGQRQIGMNPPGSDYILYKQVCLLGDQLTRLKASVSDEHLRIILFDDFRNDPGREYDAVLSLVGLSRTGDEEFTQVNASHAHRFPWLHKKVLNPPRLLQPAVRAARLRALRSESARLSSAKASTSVAYRRPPLDAELRLEMIETFRPQVDILEDILQRDLSKWRH